MNHSNALLSPGVPGLTPADGAMAAPALVAIDRDKALVFQGLTPGTQPVVVLTAASGGNVLPGQRDDRNLPPAPAYFEAISQALAEAGPIQVTGCGATSIPTVNALLAWLETCHPTIASRIVTTSLNPDRFCSSNSLLTTARNFLADQAQALRPIERDSSTETTRVPFEPKMKQPANAEMERVVPFVSWPVLAAR